MASSRRSGRPEGTPGRAVLEAVRAALRRLAEPVTLVLAFSGGRDSTVLLDALVRLWAPSRIVAWHVHHGLQPGADGWQAACEREAARQGVRFGCTRLGARPVSGQNLEAWAREARYAALWQAVARTGAAALLTAHHADDQLETVFMRLARGSGPEALGGMAPAEVRAGGWLIRPLLDVGRETIDAYARSRGLAWVEDPMNEDPALLRTMLRARVLPALGAAVPGLRENVLRSAALLRESGEAMRVLAEGDLHAAGLAVDLRSLDRGALAALPALRRNEAVRAWWRLLGLPMPTQARLAQWVAQMLLGCSAGAAVTAAPWRFRRYRDRITVEPIDARDWRRDPPPSLTLRWHGEPAIALPGWHGRLGVVPAGGPGVVDAAWLAAQPLEVRAPPAAARLRPRAGGPSRTLKNLYQERGVPPWLRVAMPAVFAGGRLIYAAGLGMDAGAHAADAVSAPGAVGAADRSAGSGRGVRLCWRPDDPDDPRSASSGQAAAV
ncbi:MAG: tRNA lysidine(34) synthetase TilS [Burkholderiaceae bacterium]|nr:tRNA lysidine(34) synthetase TilS [Burkholderiaceae bacterium]